MLNRLACWYDSVAAPLFPDSLTITRLAILPSRVVLDWQLRCRTTAALPRLLWAIAPNCQRGYPA
ncbi:MAG TPA: hypothetical protein VE956_00380 [Nodularia sp. (in: cyanobacteria)]|nr:hypothetical protein [Nodularia sp. (in: cyanobacteria)]HYW17764.1 hypothetical protein [Nodularia sp. (in: cyanobacteria)]